MAQVKVYALDAHIDKHRALLSDAIHDSIMTAFEYPREKRFHRFIRLDAADFMFPSDRSEAYTIIEVSVFEGRSKSAKKALIEQLFLNLSSTVGIDPQDVEITLFETPKSHWGIRGKAADELTLDYRVDI